MFKYKLPISFQVKKKKNVPGYFMQKWVNHSHLPGFHVQEAVVGGGKWKQGSCVETTVRGREAISEGGSCTASPGSLIHFLPSPLPPWPPSLLPSPFPEPHHPCHPLSESQRPHPPNQEGHLRRRKKYASFFVFAVLFLFSLFVWLVFVSFWDAPAEYGSFPG